MDARKYIRIRGANENNLKNIDVDIPRNELVVLTGLSGSGKSSLAFDTIYAAGTWQVVAALDTTLGADALPYYTFFDADTKLDWEQRVRAILDKSLYDTGITPVYGQQLLTLSTCGTSYTNTDSRFALLAVRVEN